MWIFVMHTTTNYVDAFSRWLWLVCRTWQHWRSDYQIVVWRKLFKNIMQNYKSIVNCERFRNLTTRLYVTTTENCWCEPSFIPIGRCHISHSERGYRIVGRKCYTTEWQCVPGLCEISDLSWNSSETIYNQFVSCIIQYSAFRHLRSNIIIPIFDTD